MNANTAALAASTPTSSFRTDPYAERVAAEEAARHRAAAARLARVVAANAVDAHDAAMLLDMLGLDPNDGKQADALTAALLASVE